MNPSMLSSHQVYKFVQIKKMYSFCFRSLIKACYTNDTSAIRKLLTEGYTLNETSPEGESLLNLACSTNCFELAQVRWYSW